MSKLTKNQKRKKKLQSRKLVAENKFESAKKYSEEVNKSLISQFPPSDFSGENAHKTLIVKKKDENGEYRTISHKIETCKAELLYNVEIRCNGKIIEISPNRNLSITAWNFFGVAGCNYIHAGYEECDSLIPVMTSNEAEGILVAFPDYINEKNFYTNYFTLFTELDPEFDISNSESVKELEEFTNSTVLEYLSNHPLIASIDPKFVLRSMSIFKAFEKIYCGFLFYSSKKVKDFEKKLDKVNLNKKYKVLTTAEVINRNMH